MSKESYQEYLLSEHWFRMKRVVLHRDGYRCVICGATDHLEVHHKRYDDLNDFDALETLCARCHRDVHQFWNVLSDSKKNGTLKVASDNYKEELAKLLDDFVRRREKTLGFGGDTTFLTEGRHGLMNKYIHFMFEDHPYHKPEDALPYTSGFMPTYTRYNDMRLGRRNNDGEKQGNSDAAD